MRLGVEKSPLRGGGVKVAKGGIDKRTELTTGPQDRGP